MRVLRSTLSLVLVAAVAAACGGSDSPTAPEPEPGTPGTPREVKADPSFSQDVFEILTRNGCTASGCHGSGQGGLTMTSASTAYANLVGVSSVGAPGEIRVVAGDAAASYLVKKLEGASGIVGARMPLNGSPLDEIDMGNIKNWINQGAKNN